jgi:hypothetical protein
VEIEQDLKVVDPRQGEPLDTVLDMIAPVISKDSLEEEDLVWDADLAEDGAEDSGGEACIHPITQHPIILGYIQNLVKKMRKTT